MHNKIALQKFFFKVLFINFEKQIKCTPRLFLLLFLMSFFFKTNAQTNDQEHSKLKKEQKLKEVQVKFISDVKKVERTPYQVNSISSKEFKNSVADAKDVLNKISGLRIMEEGGLGSSYNLNLNGFSGQQVKVFLDGIPIDRLSSSFRLNNISVNAIERIDVYKGVSPIELGNDALGGMINIISNKKKNYLDLSYGLGSFNTHRVSLNNAYTQQKSGWTIRSSFNYNYSDNNYKVYVPIVINNNLAYYKDVPRFHNRYRSANAKIETGWVDRKFADMLLIGLLASNDDAEIQHGATMNTVYGGIAQQSFSLAPTFKYAKNNLLVKGFQLNAYALWNHSKTTIFDTLQGIHYNWLGDKIYTPGSNAGELSRNWTNLNDHELSSGINLSYALHKNHILSLNHSFSSFNRTVFDQLNPDKIENKFPKRLDKQILAFSYAAKLSNKWNSTLFVKNYSVRALGEKQYDFALATQRIEKFENNKNALGYGIATTYFIKEQLQLKASYEKAYRMPNPEEIFGDGLFVNSNIDLQPEQSDNYNLGLSYAFQPWADHKIEISTSGIIRYAKDLIYKIATVSSPVTKYANLSQTQCLGTEAAFLYRYKNRFNLGANITYQNITDQADYVYVNSTTNGGKQTNYQKGFRVPNTPYLFSNAHWTYHKYNSFQKGDQWTLRYQYQYIHSFFLTWAALGSKDQKKVIPTQESHSIEVQYALQYGKYSLSLECRNLFDAKLYDRFYLQKPGRSFYLKLRWSL